MSDRNQYNPWVTNGNIYDDYYTNITHMEAIDSLKLLKRKTDGSVKIKKPKYNGPIIETIDPVGDSDYIETLDRSSRIAVLALAELDKNLGIEFLILKNKEIADFWKLHRTNLSEKRAEEAEITRIAQLKESALNKLTNEEKKVLGIK